MQLASVRYDLEAIAHPGAPAARIARGTHARQQPAQTSTSDRATTQQASKSFQGRGANGILMVERQK